MRSQLQTLPIVAAAVLLGSTAQAQYITSPPGLLTQSGANYALDWGSYLHGSRQQYGDASMARKSAFLTQLQYRTQTNFSYTATSGQGRTFEKVELTMGHTDVDKMTSTFSTNYIGAGTKVFSGKVVLKQHTGWAKQAWGNAGTFPFTTPFFKYNGKDDLLMDWTFSKGTLENSSTQSTSRYYLDAEWTGEQILMMPGGSTSVFAHVPTDPYATPRCQDSGVSGKSAYLDMAFVVYGDHHTSSAQRGKFLLSRIYTWYTAKNSPVIAMLTVGGSDVGVDIGTKCQKLHLNTAAPVLVTAAKANGYSTAFANHKVSGAYVPYSNAFAGTTIYGQAAWSDSVTGALGLTIANRFTLPRKPTDDRACYVYDAKIGAGSTKGLRRGGAYYNPVERFKVK